MRPLDQCLRVAWAAHVHDHGRGPPARGFDGADGARRVLEVTDEDRRAGLGQGQGTPSADPLSATGHDRHLALEGTHAIGQARQDS